MFCYLTKVMPSHILDPINNAELDYLKILKKSFKPTINVIQHTQEINNCSSLNNRYNESTNK